MTVPKIMHGRVLEFMTGARATQMGAACKFGFNVKTIAAIIKAYDADGNPVLRRPPAKKKLSSKKKAMAERRAATVRVATSVDKRSGRARPKFGTAPKINNEVRIRRKGHDRVSVCTTRRDLKAKGFRSLMRPKRPFDHEKHAVARAVFCKRADWKSVAVTDALVFSDEHFIDSNDHGCRSQWVSERDSLLPVIEMSRFNVASIMIWAAIGVGWRSKIVFLDWGKDDDGKVQRMTAERYVKKCLSTHMTKLQQPGVQFMQDGARCHTAKSTMKYLAGKKVAVVSGWPAYSPDFNPIEMVWRLLDCAVSELGPARNVEELKGLIERAWYELPQYKLDAFVRHFKSKMAEEVRNGKK
jgi:hypothetical protein